MPAHNLTEYDLSSTVYMPAYYLIAYDISSARTRRMAAKHCKQAGLRRMQKSVFAGEGLPEKIREMEEILSPLLVKDDRLCVMPLDARAWKTMQITAPKMPKAALLPPTLPQYF